MELPLNLATLLAKPDACDAEVLQSAADYYCVHELNYSSNQELKRAVEIANRQRGTDFATALLYHHFVERLDAYSLANFEPTSANCTPKIVIVPGAFYREHPTTGGDGRAIISVAEQQGWQCETIPTESVGTLQRNAAIIGDYLESSSERVLLASLSKGTSDVTRTLEDRPELIKKLAAWISVSGILFGTPMADWLLERRRLRPALWYMKWKHAADLQAVRDLRSHTEESQSILNHHTVSSPMSNLPTFHIAGFPLKRHLSGLRAKLWHRRLSSNGPNDSVIMLENLLDAHGTVIPVWGADHYLKSSWDSARAIATIVKATIGNRKDR